jgi:hypothetical protein
LENLLVYRLRLTLLNKSVWLAIVNTAGDNAACLLAVPGLLVFAAASLGVEWLALALLRREQRVGRSTALGSCPSGASGSCPAPEQTSRVESCTQSPMEGRLPGPA